MGREKDLVAAGEVLHVARLHEEDHLLRQEEQWEVVQRLGYELSFRRRSLSSRETSMVPPHVGDVMSAFQDLDEVTHIQDRELFILVVAVTDKS